MKAEEVLQKLLDVQQPWYINDIREDLGKSQLDVWIDDQPESRGWFGRKQSPARSEGMYAWRHINLGKYRCIIHAPIVSGMDWSGNPEMPFTQGMVRWIDSMVMGGIKPQHISSTLDIPVSELWKVDSVRHSGLTAPGTSAQASAEIPGQDAVIWERLLDGSANIDIHFLGLKFLLNRMREQSGAIQDPAFRKLKAQELHTYFTRFAPTLGHEIAQVRAL